MLPIDPNAHYYFFSTLVAILATATSILSALVVLRLQQIDSKIDWARARLDDIDDSAHTLLELETMAGSLQSQIQFEALVDSLAVSARGDEFPEGPNKARIWAKNAGRILRESPGLRRKMVDQTQAALAVVGVTIAGSLLDITLAQKLSACVSSSVLAYCFATVMLVWSFRELVHVAKLASEPLTIE